MDGFNAGMAFAAGEDFDDRQPLRRELETVIPQLPDDRFESLLGISQLGPLDIK
jgi:hypothetical protein